MAELAAEARSARPSAGAVVRLSGIRWRTYERLLREQGERPIRMTYDRGELEIMTLSYDHENEGANIKSLLEILFDEADLRFEVGGSTTMRREDLARGFEPDTCYWIANVDAVLGKRRLNLSVDPPPDLVLGVDITHSSLDRLSIFAAFGVPEIWRWHQGQMTAGLLQSDGSYRFGDRTPTFPWLALGELSTTLRSLRKVDQMSRRRRFRRWLLTKIPRPEPR